MYDNAGCTTHTHTHTLSLSLSLSPTQPNVCINIAIMLSIVQDETKLGACNRAKRAYEAYPHADLSIGIENGMMMVQNSDDGSNKWVDVASIWINLHRDAQIVESVELWSDELPIPDELVRKRKGNANWHPSKDPHALLSGRTRQSFLADTLIQWCRQQDSKPPSE
jgi:hypothetical protein